MQIKRETMVHMHTLRLTPLLYISLHIIIQCTLAQAACASILTIINIMVLTTILMKLNEMSRYSHHQRLRGGW